jgi:hypothetical protein
VRRSVRRGARRCGVWRCGARRCGARRCGARRCGARRCGSASVSAVSVGTVSVGRHLPAQCATVSTRALCKCAGRRGSQRGVAAPARWCGPVRGAAARCEEGTDARRWHLQSGRLPRAVANGAVGSALGGDGRGGARRWRRRCATRRTTPRQLQRRARPSTMRAPRARRWRRPFRPAVRWALAISLWQCAAASHAPWREAVGGVRGDAARGGANGHSMGGCAPSTSCCTGRAPLSSARAEDAVVDNVGQGLQTRGRGSMGELKHHQGYKPGCGGVCAEGRRTRAAAACARHSRDLKQAGTSTALG